MIVYQQGAMDSLYAAKRAVERAIEYYEQCPGKRLDTQEGPLFAMRDHCKTARDELTAALQISKSR